MSNDQRAAQERFCWNRYTKILHDQGIKRPFCRWLVRRAKVFIGRFPDRQFAALGKRKVTDYLSRMGCKAAWKAWQFRRVVDAIRILYSTDRPERAPEFD